MSTAPQTLIDLRHFLANQEEVERLNFSITGRVTARRPSGFHLGKADIYGEGGEGDEDYSIQHRRNRRGLTNASAGFDIRLPKGRLKLMAAYLVDLAAARNDETADGRTMLFEVIGPDKNGDAKRWARTNNWHPEPARKDHEWHIHLGFMRDTEFDDKRQLFDGFYGTAALPDTVREGDRGPLVELLHDRLNVYGHKAPVPGNAGYGIFGPRTKDDVIAFQTEEGLIVDGVVGPSTWELLLIDPEMTEAFAEE